ncbi:MAG: phosphoglycerate dehydrogenase [Candidatus Omnitrophota bacterium]
MKILVSDPLSADGLKLLKDAGFEVDEKIGLEHEALKKIIKNYDALLVRSATKVKRDLIEEAKNLKVIGRAGVGLDNVDLAAATERGIIVMNTPAGNTVSTAELTMSMILSLTRNIPQAHMSLIKGEWKRSKFLGAELYSKTLGIIGLGRIGKEVSKRAASFGMKIIAYDPFITVDKAKELGIEVVGLDKIFKLSDYITVHTPLTDETKNLISDQQFKMMKKGVRIINCARGGIVNEKALAENLASGKVSGAALDVFEQEPLSADSPLRKFENVILTPHIGASTEEAQLNVALEVAESVRDALLGRSIRNAANYPSVDPAVYKILEPYINLSEKLGLFSAQLASGRISNVDISFSGQITQYDVTPMTMALMKGLLFPVVKEAVNYINALNLAKERGIKIQESRLSEAGEFSNLITVTLNTDKAALTVSGTVFAKNLIRIVKINDFYVEAIPQGDMLITYNLDKPGVVGNLGTILGKHKINIASMTFGREKGHVLNVLSMDSSPKPEVLEEIRSTKNIVSVKLIKL